MKYRFKFRGGFSKDIYDYEAVNVAPDTYIVSNLTLDLTRNYIGNSLIAVFGEKVGNEIINFFKPKKYYVYKLVDIYEAENDAKDAAASMTPSLLTTQPPTHV